MNPVARFLGGTRNGIWVEGDGSPHPRGHERRGKGAFHEGMLAGEGELGQWDDGREERGVEPGGEIPRGTWNEIWGEGEDHPHPNLPPSRGKGGRGAGSFGNGRMAVGDGLNPVARFLGGTRSDMWGRKKGGDQWWIFLRGNSGGGVGEAVGVKQRRARWLRDSSRDSE